MSGKVAHAKRAAAISKGSMSLTPSLIIEKLKPQIAITLVMSNRSRPCMACLLIEVPLTTGNDRRCP